MIEHIFRTEIGHGQLPVMVRRAIETGRPVGIVTVPVAQKSREEECKRAGIYLKAMYTPHQVRKGLVPAALLLVVDELHMMDPHSKIFTALRRRHNPVWMRTLWGMESLLSARRLNASEGKRLAEGAIASRKLAILAATPEYFRR